MTARYDLTPTEIDEERARLLDHVASEAGTEPVVVAWVHPDASAANVIRTMEAEVFPEITAFMSDEVEERSRFLVVVDRAEEPRLVHVFRVTGGRFGPAPASGDVIGIPMVDEVIEANDDVTAAEVLAYYREHGIDLWRCIAVETNFRIAGGRAASGLRWSDYAYLGAFGELMRGEDYPNDRGIFAHMNEPAVRSLAAIGVTSDPFAGRPELRSPAAQEGTYDDRYSPLFIPPTPEILGVMREIVPLAAVEVVIEPDG